MQIKKHIIDAGIVRHESEDEYVLTLTADELDVLRQAMNLAIAARKLLEEHHFSEDSEMDMSLASIQYGCLDMMAWKGPIE